MNKEKVFRLVLAAILLLLVFQFGFRPMMDNDRDVKELDSEYWTNLLEKYPSDTDYDVIIYGAEPQGIAAAVSSARLGARTLLISEDYDMGGIISRCLIPELEIPASGNGRKLNGGILDELDKSLGDIFTAENYTKTVNEIMQAEENLSAVIGSSVTGVNMSGNHIDSVEVITKDGQMVLSADMFIDASDEGTLLDLCGVPYFTGSGDLNMENCFMPVSLNFEMIRTNASEAAENSGMTGKKAVLGEVAEAYEPLHENVRLEDLCIFFLPGNKAVVSGLEVSGVNVLDDSEMKAAYELAAQKAESLSRYLSERFEELSGYTFFKAADSLRVRESRHYAGRYVLSADDVIEGRYFSDTAAMGSYPVLLSKFSSKGSFVAWKPDCYAIPLRSLVPQGVTNLLMAGPRISCSSLAASSAYALGTCIAEGEAAGTAAVVCTARNESPAFLEEGHKYFQEFTAALAGKKMYLPDRSASGKKDKNWASAAGKKLLSLGLIAAGTDNDLKYNAPAGQKDFVYILLNGIYRLDSSNYDRRLSEQLQNYISNENLTYDSMMKILGILYGVEGDPDDIFEKLCRQNRINGVFMEKLDKIRTNADTITMDMVYYIGAYSICSYTGKDISDETLRPLFAG